MDTFGYGNRVIFPIRVRPLVPGAPVALALELFYQVCDNICIPVSASLELDLAARAAGSTAHSEEIALFEKRVPTAGDAGPIEIEAVIVVGAPGRETLEVRALSSQPFTAPDLIVEGPMDFRYARPEVTLSSDRYSVVLRLAIDAGPGGKSLKGSDLVLTLLDAFQSCETEVSLLSGT